MAIETNELIDVKTLSPFKRFIMTIGNLPTSYLESMTYAELLMWFCNYLQETVIPTVNNNGEAVEELQGLYEELKTYVDEYFDNLDVQDEINNKLDEMASQGELVDILNAYVIPYVDELASQPTLFIGDSYTNQVQSYAEYYKSYVGLSNDYFFKYASGGAGWYATGTGGKTYTDNLQIAINNMTSSQKAMIKNIIVGCGVNDANYNSSQANIKSGISSFISLATANFPNANIYVLNCGFLIGKNSDNGGKRLLMDNNVVPVTLDCNNGYNTQIYVINNSNMWLRNNGWFNEDGIHPNDTGQKVIAKHLVKALHGDTNVRYHDQNLTITVPDPDNTTDPETLTLNTEIINETVNIRLASATRLYNVKNLTTNTLNEIGTWSSNVLHFSNNQVGDIQVICRVVMSGPVDNWINAYLRFGIDGKVYLYPQCKDSFSDIFNFTLQAFNNTQNIYGK